MSPFRRGAFPWHRQHNRLWSRRGSQQHESNSRNGLRALDAQEEHSPVKVFLYYSSIKAEDFNIQQWLRFILSILTVSSAHKGLNFQSHATKPSSTP